MKTLRHTLALLLSVLLIPVQADAQDGAKEKLMRYAGNIHQFNEIFPQEKIYLQFDNTSYYTGETIWFKAFVVSASTLQRAESKVLYVDLLSPDGRVLKQEKLKITAGQADGSFPLIDGSTAQAREVRGVVNYPSGFYEVRAYTAFMQNFGNDNVYSRVFAVYDKPKEEGGYYDSNPTITIRSTAIESKRPETPKQRDINVSFQPEGGHIIIGQPCRVAYKVSGENGLGIDALGVLEGSDVSFSTIHDGMGTFTFTPTGKRTSVEFSTDSDTRKFQLPDAEEEGCTMQVSHSQTGIVADIFASEHFNGKTLGLTLTCRGELYDFQTVDISNGTAGQEFDMTTVPEGVCRLTLFDQDGSILATRSLYNHNPIWATPTLTATFDKESYQPFQQVNLQLNLKDGNGVPFRDRFALAVRDSRSQGNAMTDDIRTSLLLSSDLKGFIEHPDWYFESTDEEHLQALDLLCMVQGWERYDWQTMTGQKEFKEKHRLEKSLTLNGWILSPSGNRHLAGTEVNAAIVPVDKSLFETFSYTTDETGYFGFDIGVEFYDKARLSISAGNGRRRSGSSARIQLERSMTPDVRAYMPAETTFGSMVPRQSPTARTRIEDDGLATVINIETGYLLPDVEIDEHRKFVDYYTFNAFDVLTDVEKDLDKGEFTTDVTGYLMEKGYQVWIAADAEGNDSVEINGFEPFFYVHDSRKLRDTGIYSEPLKIDTRDIKGIMVYDHPLYQQEAWLLAPLFIERSNKRLQNLDAADDGTKYKRVVMVDILLKEEHELSTRSEIYKIDRRVATVDGYSRPYAFYSPEYPNGPIFGDVDYRRTLYWNPNVITDSNGQADVQFYNSSITKHFNVSAAGITASGQPYSLGTDY